MDEAFFGFARTGKFNDKNYPFFLNWNDDLSAGKIFSVLGEEMKEKLKVNSGKQEIKISQSENIIMVEEADLLIQRPKLFVDAIMEINRQNKFRRLIYTPLIGDPYLFPILALLGVSIQDNFISDMDGIEKIAYRTLGRMKTERDSREENSSFLLNISEDIQSSIRNSTLFDIVEKFSISSKAVEIFRILLNDYQNELEEVFPRRTQKIMASSNLSLLRPDITRFQDYMKNSYVKPDARTICLFLPCSARKPYSESKSHKRVFEAIGDLRDYIHEIILTSPIGIVPRELEETYPSAFYDIPVTGRWSGEEQAMLSGILKGHLNRNRYEKAFAFLTDDYMFAAEYLPEGTEIIEWNKKNDSSYAELRNRIAQYVTETRPTRAREGMREKFNAIIDYQFGKWLLPYTTKGKIIRNYNQFMIVIDGKPSLIYQQEKGKMAINKNFTAPFIENGKFLVEIDDFKPTANIYAVGILSATPEIRTEDEVVLHHAGQAKGVGTAKMPVSAMVNLNKGVAIKVRN
ncbi:MAG: DUF5591 domain-containing protein [Thermoplasmataceae archaeon]